MVRANRLNIPQAVVLGLYLGLVMVNAGLGRPVFAAFLAAVGAALFLLWTEDDQHGR